jgi:uncharacterized protein involved in outer membrane biogenesis
MVKRILLVLVGLVFLLLLAAVLVPILFKDKIEARVKAEVNKNVNAQVEWGEWSISLFRNFPNLTVTMQDIVVTNNAPFEGIQLANIGEVTLTVDIKSVFGDKIDIRRIGFERPLVHAKVLADGTANWDIALAGDTVADPASAADTSSFHVGLREYWVNDGRVIYEDASLPMFMELRGLDHRGTGDFTQDLFVLSTTTTADTVNVTFDGTQYLRRVKADIKADIDMDLTNMKFTFRDNEASINQLVLGFDGWVAMPGDDIDMDITWNTKRSDLATLLSLVPAEFTKDLSGVEMSGKAAFNGFVKGVYNEKNMPGFGLVVDVDNGRFKYPDLPNSVENIFVDLKVNSPGGADMDGVVVDMRRFAMTLAGNPIEARMHLSTPISDPNVDAELRAQMDLASVKTVVPMEEELRGNLTADVRMKGRMSAIEQQRYDEFTADGRMILLNMSYRSDSLPVPIGIKSLYFDFSPRFLSLSSFDGTVGSSSIQAKGRLDNYIQWWLKDSTLTGSFDLTADRFDLNELMGPEQEGATAEAAPADTAKMDLIEVPGNIDFRMNARVGEVKYDNMLLSNARGTLHVHDSRVDLQKVFFNVFDGAVTMDGAYDTREKNKPMIDLRYDVKDVDIQQAVESMEMIQKMAPIAKTAFGKFSTDLSMTAQLDQHMEVLMNTITGRGTMRTKNVRVDGFKPLVQIAQALKIQELQNTNIQDVLFTYLLQDGKMITEPFDVKLDRVTARVGGSTAFADQAIDYDMKAKIPSSIFGAGASEAVSGLLGQANRAIGANFQVPAELDVTVKITGTIDNPTVKPVFAGGGSNVRETIKEEVKEQINVQIDRAREEALAKAMAERDRLVAEAQKQADQLKADARREAANLKGQAYKAADDELAKVTNPLARAAAKVVADKAKQEADKREQQSIAEADRRADGLVDSARKQGDDLVRRAESTETKLK